MDTSNPPQAYVEQPKKEEEQKFRPRVQRYPKGKFHVDDKVYVRSGRALAGPYLVSSVTSAGTYVLCTDDGTKVESGREYAEADLEHASG